MIKKLKIGSLSLVLSCVVAILFLSSCSNDDDKDVQRTIEMTIYSDTGFAGYFMSDNLYGEFLLFSEEGNKNVNVLTSGGSSFDDFDYEKGYEYKVKARKTTLANPPQDASSIVYDYLETISKKKVVTENSEQQIEIEVGPKKLGYIARSQNGRQEAFFIKENGAENTKIVTAIDNFNFEEGNRYKLKVKKVIQAEPYVLKYILIEVVSKVKI